MNEELVDGAGSVCERKLIILSKREFKTKETILEEIDEEDADEKHMMN